MRQYGQYSDEELIGQLREGQEEIRDYLMEKYKNLVRKKARALYLMGGDSDDLMQEGMIGLYKAIRDYDPGRGASFYTFADLCVGRQLYTAVEASRRQKHMPLNTYVSLSDGQSEEGRNGHAYRAADRGRAADPEELLIAREDKEDMETAIEKRLSRFEKQVLRLYLTGMNYSQIAETLGKSSKSTDNALQRIKQKVKEIIGK